MSGQESSPPVNDTPSVCEVISNPSKIIKHFEKVIDIKGVTIHLTLVTMKRSFILGINNAVLGELPAFGEPIPVNDGGLSRDDMIRGFMDSNSNLKGLSLAIGEVNTCIINSDNSLASATLASRLSKKLNQNMPVYVANNFRLPHDTIDSSGFMASLYLKVFQFVQANYSCPLGG